MKKVSYLLAIFFLFVTATSVYADILITQVYYDPGGADSGKEWVELYNTENKGVSLKNFSLETGDGSEENDWNSEWTGIKGDFIGAKGFYLIGEYDSMILPDHVTDLDLQNGPDGCRIIQNGNIVDTVGWGEHEFSEYFEGTPSVESGSGKSLQRRFDLSEEGREYYDSENNFNDFFPSLPNPKNSLGNAGSIDLVIEIEEDFLEITNITLSGNDNPDFSILPFPGDNKTYILNFTLSYSDYCSEIKDVGIFFNGGLISADVVQIINDFAAIYSVPILISYDLDPGNYSVTVQASAENGCYTEQNSTFNVLEVAALRLDSSYIEFNNLSRGKQSTIFGDKSTLTADKPTIKNIGNTKIDLVISGSNLVSGDEMINITNLNISLMKKEIPVETEPFFSALGLECSMSVPFNLSIYIPEGTGAGKYIGSLTLSAQSSE